MCSNSFNMTDRIRVIDGSEDVVQVVRSAIQEHWRRGLQAERVYYGCPEFKLCSTPWFAGRKDILDMRFFLMQLVVDLERAGWFLYASVALSNTTYSNHLSLSDLDTWVLKRREI